tara:strand:- start:442 stop:945 length:504 start_codon:yes stop_codon:yes gene_type:complete
VLDPATIGLAIAGVKTAADLVKKGISAAKDINEVTKDLGQLFDHKETLSKAKKELSEKGKSKSISQSAMDVVMAERAATKALADIKQRLLWGPYSDGGQIWKDFLKQRQTMIREQKLAAEREKARKQKLKDNIIYCAMIIAILGFGGFMVYYLVMFTYEMGQKAGKW